MRFAGRSYSASAPTSVTAMLQTPDGHGRLELFEYIHPGHGF
ncbi:hypothetical protein [Gordonia sp. NPDC058843]